MFATLSLALLLVRPAKFDGYAPVKNAFARVAESIKGALSTTPVTFYTGTSLVGGLVSTGKQISFTITPPNGGSMAAFVGKEGGDGKFTLEITSGGQSVLSDANEFGGVFTAEAHKQYKIVVTNTGPQAYTCFAIMIVGKTGASHSASGLTKAVSRISDAMAAGISQGYKIPLNRESLQGLVLTPTHLQMSRPLYAGKDWMALATCDGVVGDLKLSLYDEQKAILSENENTDDVCAVVSDKAVPHGGFSLSSPKNKNVLTVSCILVKD